MAVFRKKVLVTLIDDATGTTLAESSVSPGDLPESFEIATTLHLGDANWVVVHAEPQTREQYTNSGRLTVRLRKLEESAADAISFSQLDITDGFDDARNLGADDWVSTTPLNASISDPQSAGLPPPDADSDEVYRIASQLSELRESLPIPDDGVYCPICHIANIDLGKLRTPCPKCGRELLKFGWD